MPIWMIARRRGPSIVSAPLAVERVGGGAADHWGPETTLGSECLLPSEIRDHCAVV